MILGGSVCESRAVLTAHFHAPIKTGKARAAIRRYWQYRDNSNVSKLKSYNTTLWISLPDQPGSLGDVTSMIGSNKMNGCI